MRISATLGETAAPPATITVTIAQPDASKVPFTAVDNLKFSVVDTDTLLTYNVSADEPDVAGIHAVALIRSIEDEILAKLQKNEDAPKLLAALAVITYVPELSLFLISDG